MVDAGCDLASSRAALALAKAHRGVVFAGVGVHPHDATTYTDEVGELLREMAQEPEVVAIGEFGLDYYRMLSPREIQRAVFCAHLQLARECNLPCIIHVRDSHDDVIELLRTHGQGLRGVFHCFSGNVAQAEECLSFEGFLLSFARSCERPCCNVMTWRTRPPAAFSSFPGLKIFNDKPRRIAFVSRMSRTLLRVNSLSVTIVILSLLWTISVFVSFKSYRVWTSRRV